MAQTVIAISTHHSLKKVKRPAVILSVDIFIIMFSLVTVI